jgi:hypothetical protein
VQTGKGRHAKDNNQKIDENLVRIDLLQKRTFLHIKFKKDGEIPWAPYRPARRND